jgi:7-cyano-7-deazaguanine synthase
VSAPARAVVLLSGGMDSAVVLAHLRAGGFECHALSFDYGQRHRVELERAAELARALGAADHRTARIDLRAFGASALTADIAVPKGRDVEHARDIPVTYVPARNTIFLAHALAMAESLGARDIGIGVNAIDYSGYPDCRPEYVEAFERLANLATRAGVEAAGRGERWIRVRTPLLSMSKADIVRRGRELGVPLDRTVSCYDPGPDGAPCGRCDACQLRERGFREAG